MPLRRQRQEQSVDGFLSPGIHPAFKMFFVLSWIPSGVTYWIMSSQQDCLILLPGLLVGLSPIGIEWTGKNYWLEMGEDVETGRAEGLSAIVDRAGCSFTHTWHRWHRFWFWFVALFNSVYFLEKWFHDVCVVAFFLVIDDIVALDCILNDCCNLCNPFYIWVLCLKN